MQKWATQSYINKEKLHFSVENICTISLFENGKLACHQNAVKLCSPKIQKEQKQNKAAKLNKLRSCNLIT